jgi:hypothetical protein
LSTHANFAAISRSRPLPQATESATSCPKPRVPTRRRAKSAQANTSADSTKICHHSSHRILHFVCDISHSRSAGYNACKANVPRLKSTVYLLLPANMRGRYIVLYVTEDRLPQTGHCDLVDALRQDWPEVSDVSMMLHSPWPEGSERSDDAHGH